VFYAWCSVVDDVADCAGLDEADRRERLDRWRQIVSGKCPDSRAGLEREMGELIEKYNLPRNTLGEIITGVEMDIRMDREKLRYPTIESLKQYCYRVASAVGLISIEIFGYRDTGSRDYAEKLGYAFQLTNILRDVSEDAGRGRIYLPLEDLEHFGVSEADLVERKASPEFVELMRFEGERAEAWYRDAEAALPAIDRRSMRSAELMRAIYSRILARMKADGYRVLEKRYRLSKLEMVWRLVMAMIR
jgi:phytoene synthase